MVLTFFTDNFCTVMKLNGLILEESFLIRHKRESQRETECRSVNIHAVQMILILASINMPCDSAAAVMRKMDVLKLCSF